MGNGGSQDFWDGAKRLFDDAPLASAASIDILVCAFVFFSSRPVSIENFPGLASHPTAHELKNAGIAAKHRHDAKTPFYADRWTLNENVKLMPLILETGGRWHPDVTNEIKRHLKDVHRSNIPQYVYHLKATTQRVAVALRRMVVKGIVALHRRLGGYPLAQGVGAGAGAGGPGGPGG